MRPITARLWYLLSWIDCWITHKWLGRKWEYYSAILGRMAVKHGGNVSFREHPWQSFLIWTLDKIDPGHVEKALLANPPREKFTLL